MDENRQNQRQRTFKGGTISFGLAAASIDCVIKNISATGGCLEVESPVGIPDDFTLVIKPDYFKRACKVVWCKARKIGVRFV
jgi:hypothetical protein